MTGCDRVSAGCDHCYALTLPKLLKAMGQPKYQNDGDPRTSGPGFGVTVHPQALGIPLRWRQPRMVFVNSMSDLFHARVPRDFVHQVFEVMAATPQHTYQILTFSDQLKINFYCDLLFHVADMSTTCREGGAASSRHRHRPQTGALAPHPPAAPFRRCARR